MHSLERPREQHLQKPDQAGREALVEAALLDGLPGYPLVPAPQPGQRALAAARESQDEHPDQVEDPDLPLTPDGAAPQRQLLGLLEVPLSVYQ